MTRHEVSYTDYRRCVVNAVKELAYDFAEDPETFAVNSVRVAEVVVRESYDNGVSVDALANAII